MPQPLTFEQFVERIPLKPKIENDPGTPRYDNFPLYFMPDGVAPHLRRTPQFLELQAKEPDLEARLTHNITHLDRSINKAEALRPFEPEMHEAYVFMFEYLIGHNSANPDEDLLIAPE